MSNVPPRRHFLGRAAALTAGLMIPSLPAVATTPRSARRNDHPDAWLARVTGRERALFDAPEIKGGRVLGLIRHFYDTYEESYGLGAREVTAIGALYGQTAFLALNDSMWARYGFGRHLEPAWSNTTRNPWNSAGSERGSAPPGATIAELQERGAVFLVCRAALRSRAADLAAGWGHPRDVLLTEWEAHLLPGVILVPSVILAVQRATDRGIAAYRV